MSFVLPIIIDKERKFSVGEHSGDIFGSGKDFDGFALTIELRTTEEARAVLGALFSEREACK